MTKIKYVQKRGVAIKQNKENQKEKLKSVFENIKNSLGQNYEVKIPEKKIHELYCLI